MHARFHFLVSILAAFVPAFGLAQTYVVGDATASTLAISTTIEETGASAGLVTLFAGNYTTTASGQVAANGQSLDRTTNSDLFAATGTTYGSTSGSTFTVPNLAGATILGSSGSNALGSSPAAGQLTLTFGIATYTGSNFPARDSGDGSSFSPSVGSVENPFAGQVVPLTGSTVPAGYFRADGAVKSIAQNTGLFSLVGTLYGGNGTSNFALPNLGATTPVGAGGLYSTGENTGLSPQGLALNYVISTLGTLPTAGTSLTGDMVYVGQVDLVAFTFAPDGWILAQGQSLSIAQYPDLYSVIGTTYGGDGISFFDAPDFRDRTFLSAGTVSAIPEPATYAALLGAAMFGLVLWRRRERNRI